MTICTGTWTVNYFFNGSQSFTMIGNSNDAPYQSFETIEGCSNYSVIRSSFDNREMSSFTCNASVSGVNFTFVADDPNCGIAYDCINGACLPQSTYNTPGQYPTLADCELVCGGDSCTGKCISNNEWVQIENLANQVKNNVCN
ncbi:hypothetical protein VB711_16935 [Cronbergia sp. UHCC 0137]|uniref:hypothetical protein n=1 Tax=Cronbergia sp. UHCC 0137 TaxID=3110239 RepID=UPI002B22193C|nr:hypothetical protein [Cronbergia sp. UHCC 0137]MEA5619512.1 hypothetical protein [Cronbergia sp. UHCC 0137]